MYLFIYDDITAFNFLALVFLPQTHSAVLHVSFPLQGSLQESLSEWRLWDQPQLETSYQPALADVSSLVFLL